MPLKENISVKVKTENKIIFPSSGGGGHVRSFLQVPKQPHQLPHPNAKYKDCTSRRQLQPGNRDLLPFWLNKVPRARDSLFSLRTSVMRKELFEVRLDWVIAQLPEETRKSHKVEKKEEALHY